MNAIIFSGCGGGYDIYTAVAHLSSVPENTHIILLNLSFTEFNEYSKCERVRSNLYKVDCTIKFNDVYFPEYFLAKALNEKGIDNVDVYLFDTYVAVKDIVIIYEYFNQKYKLQLIHLCDAGCDALLKGTESELGSIHEELLHIKALSIFNEKHKIKTLLSCIGWNTECRHDVKIEDILSRIEELRSDCISIETWNIEDKNIKLYRDIYYRSRRESTVNEAICFALIQENFIITIKNQLLFINENTKKCLTISLDKIIRDNIYLKDIQEDWDIEKIGKYLDKTHV